MSKSTAIILKQEGSMKQTKSVHDALLDIIIALGMMADNAGGYEFDDGEMWEFVVRVLNAMGLPTEDLETVPPERVYERIDTIHLDKSFVFKQAGSPLRLMLIVTSNAYRDREQEIISQKALTDYVESCWEGEQFVGDNVHLLWHDGDPIGDIIYADMEGPFLIEVSRERPNTAINIARQGEAPLYTTVKTVWNALETAPDLAASHRFFYDEADREDRIYDMIVKTETSTLPRWAAANLITLSEVVKHGG